MITALVLNGPNYPNGGVFEYEGEYNSNIPYGVDRVAYHKLKRRFDREGDSLKTIGQFSDYSNIDAAVFIDIDYEYLWKLLTLDDPPKIVYVMREPPAVISENSQTNLIQLSVLFDKILTWNDSLSSYSDRFEKYHWPQWDGMKLEGNTSFEKSDLLVNISTRRYSRHPSELYSEREHIIEFFNKESPSSLSLYGQYWNKPARLKDLYNGAPIKPDTYDVYEGFIENKFDAYRSHRFALCFENQTDIDGWITEKIFDCFRSGIVPVYWGADNVSEFIPPETFVDYREYSHPKFLLEHLRDMDRETHQTYLRAAQEYLTEVGFNLFSPETYAKKIHLAATESTGQNQKEIPPELLEKIKTKGRTQQLVNESESMSVTNKLIETAKVLRDRPETFVEQPGAVLSLMD